MTVISLFSQLMEKPDQCLFPALIMARRVVTLAHPPAFTIIAMMNIGHNSFVALETHRQKKPEIKTGYHD